MGGSRCHLRRYRLSADVLRYPLPEAKSQLSTLASAAADKPDHLKRNKFETETPFGPAAAAAAAAASPRGIMKCQGEAGIRRLRNGEGEAGKIAGGSDASEFVSAFDGALPEGMLRHLQVRSQCSGSRLPVRVEHSSLATHELT